MADFQTALPWVLNHETIGWPAGADGQPEQDLDTAMAHVKALGHLRFWFTQTPGDRGGATAWGMTLKTAAAHGIATVEDLQAIDGSTLASIYQAEFWRFDGLDDERVAKKLLDLAVNTSFREMVHLVQGALNAIGAGLAEDGNWGPATEASINATEPGHLLALLVEASVAHYRAIVQRDPSQSQFLPNWLGRAAQVPTC